MPSHSAKNRAFKNGQICRGDKFTMFPHVELQNKDLSLLIRSDLDLRLHNLCNKERIHFCLFFNEGWNNVTDTSLRKYIAYKYLKQDKFLLTPKCFICIENQFWSVWFTTSFQSYLCLGSSYRKDRNFRWIARWGAQLWRVTLDGTARGHTIVCSRGGKCYISIKFANGM